MKPCTSEVCPRPLPESFVTTPSRCKSCGHSHFWRDPCDFFHFHRLPWSPDEVFEMSCDCTGGVSRALTEPSASRRTIPEAVRRAVRERDGDRCCFCGRRCLTGGRAKRWPKHRLTLDHIIPYSKGGADTADNLRVACLRCNVQRGTRDLLPLLAERA